MSFFTRRRSSTTSCRSSDAVRSVTSRLVTAFGAWLSHPRAVERGTPRSVAMVTSRGNSQASALTATTTSGGESPGATRAGMILKPVHALFEKAFAPEGHDLSPGVETPGDRVIGPTFGRQQDHLGADDLEMGSRIGGGSLPQHSCFLSREEDLIRTGSRHRPVATRLAHRVAYSRFQYKQKTLAYL